MTNSGLDFFIDKAVRCFFVKHYGVFDREIALRGNQSVVQHPDFKRDLNRVIDVRRCTIDLSNDDVRDLSRNVARLTPADGQYRGAYLVDSSLAFGLARVFNSFADNSAGEYKIFKDDQDHLIADLKNWLNLDEGYSLPNFMDPR